MSASSATPPMGTPGPPPLVAANVPAGAGGEMSIASLNPTDMEIDVEESLALDHEMAQEKVDADFFNDFPDDFDLEDLA